MRRQDRLAARQARRHEQNLAIQDREVLLRSIADAVGADEIAIGAAKGGPQELLIPLGREVKALSGRLHDSAADMTALREELRRATDSLDAERRVNDALKKEVYFLLKELRRPWWRKLFGLA